MAKKKVKKAVPKLPPTIYKDYDMKWLKGVPEHPEFGLVAEYEKKYEVTV